MKAATALHPAPAKGGPSRAPLRDREIHPVAWWVWGLALATAANRTTNPLLLLVMLAVVGYVVAGCRPRASWSTNGRGFGAFLRLGLIIIAIRLVFRLVLGSAAGGTDVLFTLPRVPLPAWASGVTLGGTVYADGLIATVYDAARLAVLLCCIGAAVVLANPRRLLSSLPGALYEVGVAVVVGMSLAPEMIAGAQRVRRARELRGDDLAGRRSPLARARMWTRVALPILADATDHALALAASMDSRGYGRTANVPVRIRRLTGGLLLLGLAGLALGIYGLLDDTSPAVLTVSALVGGALAAVVGLRLGAARVTRSRYLAAAWSARDFLVITSGVVCAVASFAAGAIGEALDPVDVLALPQLPWLAFTGAICAVTPAIVGATR